MITDQEIDDSLPTYFTEEFKIGLRSLLRQFLSLPLLPNQYLDVPIFQTIQKQRWIRSYVLEHNWRAVGRGIVLVCPSCGKLRSVDNFNRLKTALKQKCKSCGKRGMKYRNSDPVLFQKYWKHRKRNSNAN